jgi:hypothetical protein
MWPCTPVRRARDSTTSKAYSTCTPFRARTVGASPAQSKAPAACAETRSTCSLSGTSFHAGAPARLAPSSSAHVGCAVSEDFPTGPHWVVHQLVDVPNLPAALTLAEQIATSLSWLRVVDGASVDVSEEDDRSREAKKGLQRARSMNRH